jgi:hypothetical protein
MIVGSQGTGVPLVGTTAETLMDTGSPPVSGTVGVVSIGQKKIEEAS